MKKLLAVLFFALMLASCGAEELPESVLPDEPIVSESEKEEGQKEENEAEKMPAVSEPEDHSDFLSVTEETDGTREVYEILKTGEVVTKEIPNTVYYINFKDGTPAIDHPFYYYSEICYDRYLSSNPEKLEHVCEISGSYDGNYYVYHKNENGVYELERADLKHEEEMGDFIKIWRNDGVGLKDKEENIVLYPAYSGGIHMPFEDRIIAREGTPISIECMRTYLFDTDMNLLTAEYNYIDYIILEDGSYVGYAGCDGEYAEFPCYDKNGELCEKGYWFVDKDGNKISEKFEYIHISISYEEKEDGSFERVFDNSFTVKKEGSEEETIPAETYAVKNK